MLRIGVVGPAIWAGPMPSISLLGRLREQLSQGDIAPAALEWARTQLGSEIKRFASIDDLSPAAAWAE